MAEFHDDGTDTTSDPGSEDGVRWLDQAERELDEYFGGDRVDFEILCRPVGTEFQRSVWAALQRIPFGHTTTYGALAEQIGRPSAQRAVGAANGANPIPVIIPCHRVIGSSGSLVGFGGGLHRKRWLLGHENPEQAPLFLAARPHS
jgi:methylated-DNA-[protein]-cysteine S-methyltransferase